MLLSRHNQAINQDTTMTQAISLSARFATPTLAACGGPGTVVAPAAMF